MASYIKTLEGEIRIAHHKSLIQVAADGTSIAIRNAKKQFTGRNGRRLSGAMINAISRGSGFKIQGGKIPLAFIGTKGIPYGAVHEFGDTITPKNANHLWVKLFMKGSNKFKSWTPSDFMKRKKRLPKNFPIFKSKKGNLIAGFVHDKVNTKGETKQKILPLFSLRKSVKIPKRAYLIPAVNEVLRTYPMIARPGLITAFRIVSTKFKRKGK